jgi:HlyD family secretion protein
VVQSGDELITLVPADATLAIEASLPSRDAGFVQQGNTAVIKFDTFPYTTHGTATATLQTVSADSFATPQHDRPARAALAQPDADGSATYFRAALSLDELKLRNLPAGFHMTPGMTLTADIKVGRRTVLAYLLSRAVPTLSEAMREP